MLASESPCRRLSASLKGTSEEDKRGLASSYLRNELTNLCCSRREKDATLIIPQLSFTGRPFPCQSPSNASICLQYRIPQLPVLGLLQPGTSLGKGCMCERSADK